MHGSSEVLWRFQSPLDERLVDDHLGGDVRQFAPLPCFDLLSHRREIAPYAINTNRDAIDQRERLRVLASTAVKSPANAMFEQTR